MELKTYLSILWRRKLVIVATVALAMIATAIGTLMSTPLYAASATLRIATATSGSVQAMRYDITYADRLMNTYTEIATSRSVLEELAQRLGLNRPPWIEVEILANTELMQITVENQNPILAAEAANTLAEILIAKSSDLSAPSGKTAQEVLGEQVAQIEDELNQSRQTYEDLLAESPQDSERITAASRSVELKERTYLMLRDQYEQAQVAEAMWASTVSLVEPATTPRVPSEPRRDLNIALGLIVGLVGGLGLAFLFENLDTTLRTTKQIEAVTELPSLGQIPTAWKRKRTALLNGNSPQGEAFRRLRTNLFQLDEPPLQTLLITSAEPGEGKSTVAANLTLTLAQAGREVILIDADLRLPTLHKIFKLENKVGLSSILRQETSWVKAVQGSSIPGVQIITSGPLTSNPAELLSSFEMTTLIEQLKQQCDLVILDTPALLAVADTTMLATIVDCVLLVVGQAQARPETVRAALQDLANVKANLLGVVVNRADQPYDYGHYYSSR